VAAELELARQAAIAGSTYAWVAFYDDSGNASSPQWRMVSARSLEGAAPTANTVDLTAATTPSATQLGRVQTLDGVKLQNSPPPNTSSFQDWPDTGLISSAASPENSSLSIKANIPDKGASDFKWAIEFNPLGEATVRKSAGAFPVDNVMLVVVPSAGKNPNASENKQAALIWINGLSGGVEIYQP